MPDGGSGPPSLSAVYIDNDLFDQCSPVKHIENRSYDLGPSAQEIEQDSQDYAGSLLNHTPHKSPHKYLNSDPMQRGKQMDNRGKEGNSKMLPSLVMSPNNLLVNNEKNTILSSNHDSYGDQVSGIQNSFNNHINMVATLEDDRQSTMV